MRLHAAHVHFQVLQHSMLLWCQGLKLSIRGECETTHRGVQARRSILLVDRIEVGEVVAELEKFGEVIVACASDEGVCVQVLRPCLTLLLPTLHGTRQDVIVGAARGLLRGGLEGSLLSRPYSSLSCRVCSAMSAEMVTY